MALDAILCEGIVIETTAQSIFTDPNSKTTLIINNPNPLINNNALNETGHIQRDIRFCRKLHLFNPILHRTDTREASLGSIILTLFG